jgi:phage terminase large subunit
MAKHKVPYKPREVMRQFHERTERFACLVAHRRCGKTVAAVNDLIRDALKIERENVRVAYIAPYYNQAKSIAWDYAKHYSANIPGIKINESELRIDYPGGARLRLFGADNYDAMRGLYFDAVVLDEPADFPMNAWQTVIRPALADRKGRATFIGTPKGKNEFWETYHMAKDDPSWYCAMHKASETGYVDQEELDESLKIMGEDRYEQEFECSFEAAISGAYYGHEMKAATKDGRITEVRYDKTIGVVTSWDLGVGDSTAIWFSQFMPNGDVHLIDYYENSGVGLDHYARVLQDKGYVYEYHILPHDVQVKELGTGKSRLETLDNLGVRPVEIAPKLRVDDGIQASRSMLDRCWFDEEKCDRGIEMLRQYQRDFDEKMKTWRGRPRHDFTSHGADAFRYLATGNVRRVDSWGAPIKRSIKGVA